MTRATTYDKQRTEALCKILTTPMRSADVLAHFGGDRRYSYQLHNLVAAGVVVNLNPVPKSPGVFVLATHAPADAPVRAEVERKRPGRPPGAVKPLVLDWETGAHLQRVWGGMVHGAEVSA